METPPNFFDGAAVVREKMYLNIASLFAYMYECTIFLSLRMSSSVLKWKVRETKIQSIAQSPPIFVLTHDLIENVFFSSAKLFLLFLRHLKTLLD
jgi:hypothetical protein